MPAPVVGSKPPTVGTPEYDAWLKNKGAADKVTAEQSGQPLPTVGQKVPGAGPTQPTSPYTVKIPDFNPFKPGGGQTINVPGLPAQPASPTPMYGYSADGARTIERVGTPGPLDSGAFGLEGFGGLQTGYSDAQQRALAMQNQAGVAGAQGNAAQTRAMALGALTAPGPSMAEQQLRAGQQSAASNALAMARSGRGFGAAGQMQQASMQAADSLGQVNQQAGMLRAGEEAQRRQQLMGMAGQDVGALGQAYQQQLGAGGLGLQGMQQQGQLSAMQQGALADKAKTDAQMQMQSQQTNANYANYDAPADTSGTQLAGSALGAFASMIPLIAGGALASDRARETGAGQAAGRASALGGAPKGGAASAFAALPGYSYEYKDPNMPGAAPGPQMGPMADELQKVIPGAVMPGAGPGGMDMVDPGRLALANASATGEIARKLKALGVAV
jgi:hypothetical protein